MDDLRFGDIQAAAKPDFDAARLVLIGFPEDEGVKRNGGRPGAAMAPDTIRHYLMRFTPHALYAGRHSRLIEQIYDLGNIPVSGDVEADQAALGDEVARVLKAGKTPIVLGGGHETTFGHFLGYAALGEHVHLLNWDAHPDVRPLKEGQAHSGSPFRQALEHNAYPAAGYTVAGLQPHAVAKAHLNYMKAKKVQILWRDEVNAATIEHVYATLPESSLVSLDFDVMDQAFAPGVSAPCSEGLVPSHLKQLAFLAGKHPNVRSFDLVEVNPHYDRDGQTARLAAWAIWWFTVGFSLRINEHA